MNRATLALLTTLAACGAPTEASTLESYAFGWELFNHRLSELGVFTSPEPAVEVALVGGTSTTINEQGEAIYHRLTP